MRLTLNLLTEMGKWSKKYANLPDRYIKRASECVLWEGPNKPQFRVHKYVVRKKLYYSEERPWTIPFFIFNYVGKSKRDYPLEPIKNWSYFRGDRVEVLVGRDKGKQGIVQSIVQERNWIFVRGLNTMLKSYKPDGSPIDVFIHVEKPLLVPSQVQLVDPYDLKGTPIEWRYTEEGDFVRVSLRTGKIIPIPTSSEETVDYKTSSTYRDQPKDTPAYRVKELTFEAKLKTFEMDIMDSMGIKEDRVPKKYYWY